MSNQPTRKRYREEKCCEIDPLYNKDIMREIIGFLGSPSEANAVSLVSGYWHELVLGHDDLWTALLKDRYPNLHLLSGGTSKGAREKYFHRLRMHREPYMSVRDVGLPPVLQRKIPGKILLERWKPDAIVFLLDVWRGSQRILSHGWRVSPDDAEEVESYGPFGSNGLPVEYPDHHPHRNVVKMEYKDQLSCSGDLTRILNSVFKELRRKEDILDGTDLYVSVAYSVEGLVVPPHEPIFILSEHSSFFSSNTGLTMDFRTDCKGCWLMSSFFNQSPAEYLPLVEQNRFQRDFDLSRQYFARYGSAPIPFDPHIQLLLSPPGFDESDDSPGVPLYENDSLDVWSYFIEFGFARGEDSQVDFSRVVLPTLLSLWHDAARNHSRKCRII